MFVSLRKPESSCTFFPPLSPPAEIIEQEVSEETRAPFPLVSQSAIVEVAEKGGGGDARSFIGQIRTKKFARNTKPIG